MRKRWWLIAEWFVLFGVVFGSFRVTFIANDLALRNNPVRTTARVVADPHGTIPFQYRYVVNGNTYYARIKKPGGPSAAIGSTVVLTYAGGNPTVWCMCIPEVRLNEDLDVALVASAFVSAALVAMTLYLAGALKPLWTGSPTRTS